MSKFDVLRQTFGYPDFRPGQEEIVDALLAGRNVLAVMPTGAGKSLCYQVPALVQGRAGDRRVAARGPDAGPGGRAEAGRRGGRDHQLGGGARGECRDLAAVAAGETRILYLAPERLMTDRMLAALQKLDVGLIAIDEAHCISQWGASFRPGIRHAAAPARGLPGRSHRRLHGDRRRGDAARHRGQDLRRQGGDLRLRLRPAEHRARRSCPRPVRSSSLWNS